MLREKSGSFRIVASANLRFYVQYQVECSSHFSSNGHMILVSECVSVCVCASVSMSVQHNIRPLELYYSKSNEKMPFSQLLYVTLGGLFGVLQKQVLHIRFVQCQPYYSKRLACLSFPYVDCYSTYKKTATNNNKQSHHPCLKHITYTANKSQ